MIVLYPHRRQPALAQRRVQVARLRFGQVFPGRLNHECRLVCGISVLLPLDLLPSAAKSFTPALQQPDSPEFPLATSCESSFFPKRPRPPEARVLGHRCQILGTAR